MTLSNMNQLYIPEPQARPGDKIDFSGVDIGKAGRLKYPPIDSPETELRDYPFGLIRTLSRDHEAVGDWIPRAGPDDFKTLLRIMTLNRLMDIRFFKLQRQGKTSFYMKSSGEEALSAVPSLVLGAQDMCFPTYRLVGWLLARNYPLLDLVNQIFNNAHDPLKGKQLPVLYSARDYGFYSLSGNLGTRFGHAVGWAMAKAYRGKNDIAIGYVGEGSTAEGNFHEALTFARVSIARGRRQ